MKKMHSQTTRRSAFLAFALVACNLARAGDNAATYFAVSPGALADVKARLAAGDKSLQPALKNLLKGADQDATQR